MCQFAGSERRARQEAGNSSRSTNRTRGDPLGRGLETSGARRNNCAMKIKPTQIYSWDEEPVDERPSEFSSTTGHSLLSGYQSAIEPVRRSPRRSRFGFKTVLVFCVGLFALGATALVKLAPLLRG